MSHGPPVMSPMAPHYLSRRRLRARHRAGGGRQLVPGRSAPMPIGGWLTAGTAWRSGRSSGRTHP